MSGGHTGELCDIMDTAAYKVRTWIPESGHIKFFSWFFIRAWCKWCPSSITDLKSSATKNDLTACSEISYWSHKILCLLSIKAAARNSFVQSKNLPSIAHKENIPPPQCHSRDSGFIFFFPLKSHLFLPLYSECKHHHRKHKLGHWTMPLSYGKTLICWGQEADLDALSPPTPHFKPVSCSLLLREEEKTNDSHPNKMMWGFIKLFLVEQTLATFITSNGIVWDLTFQVSWS